MTDDVTPTGLKMDPSRFLQRCRTDGAVLSVLIHPGIPSEEINFQSINSQPSTIDFSQQHLPELSDGKKLVKAVGFSAYKGVVTPQN